MAQKKMLICDRDLCTGCRLCQMACSAIKNGVCTPALSRIKVAEVDGLVKAYTCVSCEGEPKCVMACPRHGLVRDPQTMAITVNADECDGCGNCVQACPYGAIVLVSKDEPAAVCDLCPDRDEPACVAFCPNGALKYGNILPIPRKKAKRQINISLGCNSCGECVATCSSEILQLIDGWLVPIDPSKCQVCEHCATTCPIGAIRINRRSKILY